MREKSPIALIEIQLLGAFRLRYAGEPVAAFDSPRAQELLAYLLLHRHTPQSRQQIAFLFWPESSDAQARTNLRQLLHRLRRDLPAADRLLLTEGSSLQWQPQLPFRLDVAEFEQALAEAKEAGDGGRPERAIPALKTAVAAYQGELLPDCYDEWIWSERDRLRRRYLSALTDLASLLEDRQAYEEAIRYTRQLLAQDELQEKGYRQLVRLHALAGNRAAAVRVYHNCVTVLERELGVAPAAETRLMYEQLMAEPSSSGDAPARLPSLAASSSVIGRQEEWGRLEAAWQAAAEQPHLVLVAGEAGVGKTHLAEHLLQWASRQGHATGAARCYPGEGGLAYAPIAAWLRADAIRPSLARLDDVWLAEITRILPELAAEEPGLVHTEPLTESWQQQRFFDALANAFAGLDRPLVLFLDNLQWADRATLAWLNYLILERPRRQLLIVGTVRAEEVVDDHPLNPFRWRLASAGQLTEIELGPLPEAETIELATRTAGHPLEPALASRVFRETEGNPLFVVESVRMVLAATAADEHDHFLPPRVQAVIEARLGQLSPAAREIAGLAATVNGQFAFEMLGHAGDYPEEVLVTALDELWRRRLVREVDEADYDFSHDKIREVAYAGLSRPRRQLFHRRLAQALESVHSADLDQVSARIADHYARGGEPGKAFPFTVRAADHAAAVYAYDEAAAQYEKAISLAGQQGIASKQLARLYAGRGRMLEHGGRFEEAVALYRELKDLAETRGDRAMAGLALARLVSCYIKPNAIHDLHAAEPLIDEGLVLAQAIADPALEADLLWSQMIRETHYGNTVEAQRIGERCLALAREHGLERQLGYFLHDLAINLRLAGATAQGTAYGREAQAIFRRRGNLPMLADGLNQEGLTDILHLEFKAALERVDEAHQVSRRIHNRWNLAYAVWLRGWIWSGRGEWRRALDAWQEGRKQGEQVGFLMALTAMRVQEGSLRRQLGDLAGARALHRAAHDASMELAPFMMPAVESELARDCCAAGEPEEGREWLARAREQPLVGDIAAAFFLSSLPLAELEMAAFSGEWTTALTTIEHAVQEARRRKFAWQEASLLLAQGCCLLALDKGAAAKDPLLETVATAERAGLRPLQWQARLVLALLWRREGQSEAAAEQRRAAVALVHGLGEGLAGGEQRRRFLETPAVQATLHPNANDEKGWPFPLFN